VHGVHITSELVDGATFTPLAGCTVSADKATLTCDLTELTLIPAGQDTDPDDDRWSAVAFPPGVHIAADADSPKGWPDLPGNTVAVQPLEVGADSRRKCRERCAATAHGRDGRVVRSA
jgi:hypothetical protein